MFKRPSQILEIIVVLLFLSTFAFETKAFSPLHFNLPTNNSEYYAVLSKKLDGQSFLLNNGVLQFQFNEKYNDPDGKLEFYIYNFQQNLVTLNQAFVESSGLVGSYGNHLYSLDLYDCNVTPTGYLPTGTYVLEVVSAKKEKYYLRFKHEVSSKTCP